MTAKWSAVRAAKMPDPMTVEAAWALVEDHLRRKGEPWELRVGTSSYRHPTTYWAGAWCGVEVVREGDTIVAALLAIDHQLGEG